MHFKPSIGDHNPVSVLSSFDEVDINAFMAQDVIRAHVQGLDKSDAQALYLALDDILELDDAEDILKEKVEALSPEDMALYSKFLTIRHTAKSASAIIASVNANQAENPFDIDHMIGEVKKSGVNGHQLGTILGTITHWKTGTSHPTQHLADEGIKLFRDILNVNNLPVEDRPQAVKAAITAMFDAKMTRDKKMTVREETLNDRAQAKLHRQAQRETYMAIQDAVLKHYPEDAPNLLEGYIRMTFPYHTWNGGGDCDGKPNADKRALLEGMVGNTRDAISEHLEDIRKAIELDPSLAARLKNSQKSLEKIEHRLSDIENKLYDEDEIADFDALKKQYSNVYKGLLVDYSEDGNRAAESEKEMYEKLTVGLRDVVENHANKDAKAVLAGSLFVMRQYKQTFTTAKIEKRAPGPVDIAIMDQLFGDREFQREYLEGSMQRKLANRSFTTLPDDEQMAMMKRVGKIAQMKPNKIRQHYFRIFPEGDDDKGFPNQLRERGERFELQALAPDKFGMSIVAEAKKMSPEYAFFLGEKVFGVGRMMHTMLNEDMETLENAADYVIDFTKNGGKEAFERAAKKDPRLAHYLEKHGAMLPCSDSVKQLGPAAIFLQAQAVNNLMRYAAKHNKTICIKWGNGQVLTRGGGNAHIPGRFKAQSLQWHLNGRALDPDNQGDMKILANVMFSSNTEQGRAADFMSPNAQRISSNHIKMVGEMLGRSLELMGKVERGTYITQVATFSPGARRIFGSIAKDVMMRGYENLRDAVDENGNRVSDDVAQKVSNNKIAGDANQAARPDSKAKAKDDKGKPLYDLRAIGTTVAIGHMRTFHDGWAFDGQGLRAVHEAYINREISDGDLSAFLKDPLWSSMIKNGLRTATLSDMPHAFNKLGADNWSHEKAMRIGKSVHVHPSKGKDNKPPLFSFDGADEGVTPEQAFAAKLYYDQALFVTYTEKLAQLTIAGDPPLPGKGIKPEKIKKALAKVEQASVLHLDRGDERMGRFQVGAYTNTLFPFVDQDRNGNRREMLASQVLCDVAEIRRDSLSQEQRFGITASQRATQTWNNADSYLDFDAYGSKPNPVLLQARMARVHEYELGCKMDISPDDPDFHMA